MRRHARSVARLAAQCSATHPSDADAGVGWRAGCALAIVIVCALAVLPPGPAVAQSGPEARRDGAGGLPGAELVECFEAGESPNRIEACTAVIDTPGIGNDILARAYAMRALAYSLRTDYDQAIRDYDQAIQIAPNYSVALNNRAWAYFKSGRAEKGAADVEASIRLDPLSAHSYDTRAHIAKALGRAQQALSDYRRALRLADRKLIQLYQCGLQNEGMYSGKQDGLLSEELFDAMERCVAAERCDPLPPDEECRPGTS